MYKGKPTKGLEFYNLLMNSEEFCKEFGKVTLSSGRLEAELIQLYDSYNIKDKYERATLGALISIGSKNNLLDKNLITALENTCKQRNYLTHNIYALFTNLIDETILERENLLDSDVSTYIDRVWQLKINLIDLANIISEKLKK